MSMSKYQRVNTFSQIPSPAQITSYLVFLAQAIVFYAALVPNYHELAATIIITVGYSVSLCFLIASTLASSLTDPSDQLMINYRNGQRSKIVDQIQGSLYCDYCRSYVKDNSRHCKMCNRCTQNFDHHCMWINNCVGGKNYRYFILMIVSTWFNLGFFIAAVTVLSIQNRWIEFLPAIIVAWIVVLPVGILEFLLTNLIILHIYLACNGLTTYQFIVAQKAENQIQKQREILAKRDKEKLSQQAKITDKKTKQQHEMSNFSLNREKNKVQQVSVKNQEIVAQEQHYKTGQKFVMAENIFGEKELTEKSEEEYSSNNNHKESGHQIDNQNGSQSSVRISQFFIRNKSLKILVGNAEAERPSKSTRIQSNCNSVFEPRGKEIGKETKSKEMVTRRSQK